MSRARDHRPRFDTSVCPDPNGCARLYHGQLAWGDSCECCGEVLITNDPLPKQATGHARHVMDMTGVALGERRDV